MSDDSNAPADLSSIGIDLSQIFRPSWTVESPDSSARLVAKYDEGDRPQRSDRQGGNRRPEGRDQGRGPSSGRDRDSRGPRPQSGGQGSPGGQRGSRDGGRSHDPRDRRQDDRRPEPAPKPILEGWKISLIPEPSALEAIAKQIRSRAKAYPLFELARLVVNLSDRYSITLKAESEESPKLFRVKADGSLWTSRKEATSHLLSKHLEKFYRRSSITTEAPKGSYSVVAQCGMSGILLGPPNHHEYQSRLLALHASRFKNLPFEVYKTRIKMMRDDALMEQWKSEQSTRTVFIPMEAASELVPSSDETQIFIEASEEPSLGMEALASSDPVVEASEIVESSESVEPEAVAEVSEVITEETEAIAEAPAPDGPQLTLEEATEHFQKHHAETQIEEAGSSITVAGRIALHESDPLLHDLVIKTLQELDHFPLPLAQVIGKELTGSGLQIYKAQKKIIHVSVARPRYLDRATTPTSEGFRGILDYLEAHPNQHRDKQWVGMLALRTDPAGDDPESIQRREQALGTDLLWLLHQGHVLDFAMGNLQAALRPVQQQKTVKPTALKKEIVESSEVPDSNVIENQEMIVEEVIAEETVMDEAPIATPIEPTNPILPQS